MTHAATVSHFEVKHMQKKVFITLAIFLLKLKYAGECLVDDD